MRLVEVRESALGGLGLFALRDFARGAPPRPRHHHQAHPSFSSWRSGCVVQITQVASKNEPGFDQLAQPVQTSTDFHCDQPASTSPQ